MNIGKVFDSQLARFLLSLLILLGIIMIFGYVELAINQTIYPPVVLITLLLAFYRKNNINSSVVTVVSSADYISIIVVASTLLVLIMSFFFPRYSDASLYQLLTNGWDNANHITMLQTVGNENKFVIGPFDQVQEKTIIESSTYPQAWHLATANIADGFGNKTINENTPVLTMRWYFIIQIIWYFVASYFFSKISLFLALTQMKKKNINISSSFTYMVSGIAIFTILTLTLLGALIAGHINYIGLIAYILAILAYSISSFDDDNRLSKDLIILSLLATSAILCWFLPMPAILLSVLIFIKTKYPFSLLRLNRSKSFIPAIILSISVLPLIVYVTASSTSGLSSLVAPGGQAVTISPMLIYIGGLILLYTGYKNLKSMHVLVSYVFPFFILSAFIYLYQMLTIGHSKYYYDKIVLILALLVGVLLAPCLVMLSSFFKKNIMDSNTYSLLGVISILFISVVVSGQTLFSVYHSLQRHSFVSYNVAEDIISYLNSDERKSSELLIYTKKNIPAGVQNDSLNGNLQTLIQHKPLTCVNDIIRDGGESQETVLTRLSSCANSLNIPIYVITSDETRPLVQSLSNDNVRIL